LLDRTNYLGVSDGVLRWSFMKLSMAGAASFPPAVSDVGQYGRQLCIVELPRERWHGWRRRGVGRSSISSATIREF
jgi:hypothetical protein